MPEHPAPDPEADDTHHGYYTVETWIVSAWLANHASDHHQAQALIDQAGNYFAAADALQDQVEGGNPLVGESTLYAVLLTHAIAQVRWDELAEALAPEHWMAGRDRSEADLRRFLEEDSDGEGESTS